ncbi:MAG: glutamate--tRNA ligase, partial [Candidatus Doudnabacteria bacterium]|nr:glutamate--tRNA ligase [Candidatus Doudnabacteria bacterium]
MAEISGKIRTRLAPSPTGYMHIGTLRTGLFSFLLARHNGGTNILRIEDTDQKREVAGALENLVEMLHKMGVEFDEGYYWDVSTNTAKERGDYGPYLQSKRLDLYKRYALELIEQGKAYYCFCSPERLEEVRAEQTALKKPPMYDRLCRGLTAETVQAKLAEFNNAGQKPVVRQAIPLSGETTFTDLVYGQITIQHSVLDDQVLLKSDDFATYNFANVIDDHLMGITHIIRGDEFISSTPKYVLLYQAFNWPTPQFAHLPLIVNPDKTKLSKRQGDVAVEDYLKKGYLKEALINFVVFLGWNPKSEQEFFTLEELIAQFELDKVNKAAAVLDMSKLDWINSHYIRAKSPQELAQLLIPYWLEVGYLENQNGNFTIKTLGNTLATNDYLEAIAELEQERLKKLSEIGERTAYFFQEPTFNYELLTWKKSTISDAKEKLTAVASLLAKQEQTILTSKEALEELLLSFIKENSYDTGSVLWPLR